jgi:acetylglutamate/LysW-gamma-L-alpha-aminoadipate kinase
VCVVKVGGALDGDMSRACADIAALVAAGTPVVVVHGGGAEADRLGTQLGVEKRYLTGSGGRRSRYTDPAQLDVLTLGMLGRVKPPLVEALLGLGVRAVGLSGIDGGLVTARKTGPARAEVDGVTRVVRDDLTGRIAAVDPLLLHTLLAGGFTPVVSPPALDPAVGPLNVDADRCAAAIATALGAEALVILSNVPGLLADKDDPASLVTALEVGALAPYLELAHGRMKVKVRAAAEAHLAGVPTVVLADGRHDSPVRAALAGAGTRMVTRERHVRAS